MTFLLPTVEEANNLACIVCGQLEDLNPLMAPHAMLNWDNKPWVLLEVVNSQAYRELQTLGILHWTYLVSPGMAVVCGKHQLDTVEGLEDFIKALETYNKQFNNVPAHQGGFYVERLVLSSYLMEQPGINMMLKEGMIKGSKNRVIWERNQRSKDRKAYIKESKTLDAQDTKEVVITLTNWHYTQDKNTTKSIN